METWSCLLPLAVEANNGAEYNFEGHPSLIHQHHDAYVVGVGVGGSWSHLSNKNTTCKTTFCLGLVIKKGIINTRNIHQH